MKLIYSLWFVRHVCSEKDEPRPTGMIQLDNEVFYDSNCDDDDIEEVFHNSNNGSNTNGECLDNEFRLPIGHNHGVTGTTFEEDGRFFFRNVIRMNIITSNMIFTKC